MLNDVAVVAVVLLLLHLLALETDEAFPFPAQEVEQVSEAAVLCDD